METMRVLVNKKSTGFKDWIDLPMSLEMLKEMNVFEDDDEDFEIVESELPFDGKNLTLLELEEIATKLEEMPQEIQDEFDTLYTYFGDIEEFVAHAEDRIYFYRGCKDMKDVANEKAEEYELFNGVSEITSRYFDYKAYGRDLKMDGNFAETDSGIFEIDEH